jgi:hypothetical protein
VVGRFEIKEIGSGGKHWSAFEEDFDIIKGSFETCGVRWFLQTMLENLVTKVC